MSTKRGNSTKGRQGFRILVLLVKFKWNKFGNSAFDKKFSYQKINFNNLSLMCSPPKKYSASSDLSHFHFPKKCWQIGFCWRIGVWQIGGWTVQISSKFEKKTGFFEKKIGIFEKKTDFFEIIHFLFFLDLETKLLFLNKSVWKA